jgi:hypothetical protein
MHASTLMHIYFRVACHAMQCNAHRPSESLTLLHRLMVLARSSHTTRLSQLATLLDLSSHVHVDPSVVPFSLAEKHDKRSISDARADARNAHVHSRYFSLIQSISQGSHFLKLCGNQVHFFTTKNSLYKIGYNYFNILPPIHIICH